MNHTGFALRLIDAVRACPYIDNREFEVYCTELAMRAIAMGNSTLYVRIHEGVPRLFFIDGRPPDTPEVIAIGRILTAAVDGLSSMYVQQLYRE